MRPMLLHVSIRAPARGATRVHRASSASPEFRSALPRGERPKSLRSVMRICAFRSALPRGERLTQCANRGTPSLFRSALPRGERPVNRQRDETRLLFRSALPRGERREAGASGCSCPASFDPRSREGSDPVRSDRRKNGAVSIRAPARGATSCLSGGPQSGAGFDPRSREGSDTGEVAGRRIGQQVSIRAPARGATREVVHVRHVLAFRSALPRGERLTASVINSAPYRVSIRAPARGATLQAVQRFPCSDRFDPRSREGSDSRQGRFYPHRFGFDPRSREGSDTVFG